MNEKCVVPGCTEKVRPKKLHKQHILAGSLKTRGFTRPISPVCKKHEKELNGIINPFKSNFWKDGNIEDYEEWNEVDIKDTYTIFGRVKDFGESDATFTEYGDKVYEIRVDRSDGIEVYKKNDWYYFTSTDKIHRYGYAFKLMNNQEDDD